MDFRARFAPSPTGNVHIGNIRTAIFNWLATRHVKGTFLLRIEDTDLERSTQEAIDKLMECMEWLGLDYDEEVMYQTKQSGVHHAAAQKLIDSGNAYYLDPAAEKSPLLFKLPFDCDDFPFVREIGPASIKLAPGSQVKIGLAGVDWTITTPKGKTAENTAALAGFKDLRVVGMDGSELFHLTDDVRKTLKTTEKIELDNCAELRFIRRDVFYHDLVKGDLAKPLDSMKDFIIVRTDGSPVFHLANVCDDITQRVTHIVRGDDHVENTYRHLFLFQLLGAKPPCYAHLPMIVNNAGKPYSKRDGDAFVGDFRAKGFLPQALFNYLTLLGWSPGDDREKMTRDEMIEAFDISRALCTAAQFDIRKLTAMNALYIADPALSEEEYMKLVKPFAPAGAVESPIFDAVAKLMRSRLKTFADASGWTYFFSTADSLEFDPKGMKKFLGDEVSRKAVAAFADELEKHSSVTAADVEKMIRDAETAAGLGQGKLNQPVRLGVTGTGIGAGIYETIEVIGSAESVRRIRRALTIPL